MDSSGFRRFVENMIEKIMESNDNNNKVDVWSIADEVIDGNGVYRKDMIWNQIGWEDDKSGLTDNDYVNEKHSILIEKLLIILD